MSTTTTFGNYTLEQFTTADGSFSWVPPAGVTSYDVLVVAGGGGGGSTSNGGGGGGAGGLLWLTAQSCTPGVGISGSVGGGGAGSAVNTVAGTNGTDSVFGSNTAVGGGGGGAGASGSAGNNGKAGGSGGGGGGATAGNTATGGALTSGQGSAGGNGHADSTIANRAGGGGGGKGATGVTGGSANGGDGGAGYDATATLGTAVGVAGFFAGGGGGGKNGATANGPGGTGGGGAGGASSTTAGTAGTANTGGGGGGSGSSSTGTTSGAGASGVIIVRYLTPPIAGGQVTVTSTALAGSVVGPQTIAGGLVTVTASIAAGVVLAGALVAGGLATETDTAQAGTVATGEIVAGGTATETDTAHAGTVVSAALVAGGLVTETDSALTGTVAQTVTGGQAGETDSALAGAAVFSISGGQVTETITVLAGSNGATVVSGGQVTETDTVIGGAISLNYTLTDLTNRDDGLILDGTAEVIWESDVVPRPTVFGPALPDAITVARVITTAPGWADTFSPAVASTKSIPRLRERVTIGDSDMTFLRDTPLVVDSLRFIDPLLYGSGQITAPQINPQFEPNFAYDDDGELVGTGDLTGIRRHAHVVVDLVDADDVVQVSGYWKGFIAKLNADGHHLVLELGGQASGRLSVMEVKKPGYRRTQDIEHILVDLLRDARVRAHEHDGVSGIGLIKRGEANGLDIFNETLAVWRGITGDAITFTPNATGAYRKTVKDTEAIHATAYLDSDLISQSLSRDFMSEVTRVYATGITAAGEIVSNFKTPGLTQGDAPDFPMSPGPMALGDVDADTDSGAGVTAVQQQLAIHDFYDVEDGDPGVYGAAVASAVRRFQKFAGLTVTGEVNEATWNRLWNLQKIGFSLDESRDYPTAQDIRTQKWFRTANGSKIEENPDFDVHLIPVDLTIDVGGPFGHNHITAFAESKLAPVGGVWTGTLTFKSGLIAGEHNSGDPFTTADVMDRRDLQPNMRVRLPYFMGGITVNISGIEHGPEESQAIVSTLPETTMETWAAIERMREAQSNPGSTWSGHVRKSQVRNDTDKLWDTASGWLANKVALVGGEFTEVVVPAGQTGIIKAIEMQLQDPDELAWVLTQKPLALGRLNADVPTPLTDPRPSQRPWWERPAIAAWLKERKWLDAWGTEDQPGGYDPSLKTDDQGPTAQALTGKFEEFAGLNYETDSEPVLYLYIWTWADNFLLPGRILRNQRTTDF